MATRRFLFYLISLLLSPVGIYAQSAPADLTVKRETATNAAVLFREVDIRKGDTNQVKQAVKAAHIYWHQRSGEGKLDSCFLMAKAAYQLSNTLKYADGINEAGFMLCKIYTEKRQVSEAIKLVDAAYGERRVRLMLAIGEHYVFKFGPDTPEFQKALPLLNDAIRICREYHSERWLDQCFVLQGKYRFKGGDFQGGKSAIMQVINKYHHEKNYAGEARYWGTLAGNTPENDSTYEDIRHGYEMSVHYYFLANDLKEAAYSLRYLGVINGNHNRTDSSEQQLLRVVTILKSIGEPISPTTYNILGDFYRFTGQYDKALYYILESIKVTSDAQTQEKGYSHHILGTVYEKLKDYPNSLKHYQLALSYLDHRNVHLKGLVSNNMANVMAAGGDPQKALTFLNDYVKTHPSLSLNDKQQIAATYGFIYSLLGDYGKAEKYYLEMLNLNNAVIEENGRIVNLTNATLSSGAAYFLIGKFYTERGNYSAGNQYLNKSLQNVQYFEADQELETYELLFKTDSALGNYLSAIKNMERHRILYDSINSVQKNRQVNELSMKYQTEQRLKDIALLRSKETENLAALQRANSIRNIIIGSALLMLLLAIVAYAAYRNKQRSNRVLQAQREEIDLQNKVLQSLLSQKDQFLKEKEWLLKEIHHRVKNNLQIIMSLLNSQSAHLRNTDAIEAITTSGNRVRSIALIHQKLYGGESLSSINMPEYVADLVRYMMDGFDTRERGITFIQKIEHINIDVAQAVPVGLILNEAITNAIKYAFGDKGGEITIAFHSSADGVTLSITDDGKGLPANFDIRQSNSLGMEMMQGLAKQLRGKFTISSDRGTVVVVQFKLLSVADSALPVANN